MESVLTEYKVSLADLTFNSKPHISMLTVLAEENVNYASDIVKIIERQIFQVNQKRKMPVLYLLDSIVKNFGGQYMKLFSHRLVSVFMCIFEKADGKTRGDLYKLRSTWDTIFPSSLLKDLDLTVKRVDHNWPMRAKKRHRSRNPNPLSLGHNSSTSPKFSEDESSTHYKRESNSQEVEELVEEEEIEMDDESLGVLEMLEEKLRKRQAELSRLEYLESKESDSKTPTFESPKATAETVQSNSEDEDALKMDLTDYPVIPLEDVHVHPPEETNLVVDEKKEDSLVLSGIEADLSDTKHWLSHTSSFEPRGNKVQSHDFDGMATNRVISHFLPESESPVKTEIKQEIMSENIPVDPIKEESKDVTTRDTAMQTHTTDTVDADTQISIDTKDECTQYRYRRKTKNFMSQYRVPTKTIGTYFKIKCKDAATQFDPPQLTQDTAADSTCLPLDDDLSSSQNVSSSNNKARHLHSLQVLQSFRKQRDAGMLCDITLAAQGQHFKAHKTLLASCSEFFYTLFASEAIKQSPLSYIELQGITASALSLVLDYVYTSELSVDGGVKNVSEIITAARRLKINSLLRVCAILEEAVASDQDLTGWTISNTELLSPNGTQEALLGSSGSMVLQPADESDNKRLSQVEFPGFNNTEKSRKSSSEDKDASEATSPATYKGSVKRSLSEVKDRSDVRKRKDRSLSQADAANMKKRKKLEENTKPYPCSHCERAFTKKKYLTSHISKFHPSSPEDNPSESGDSSDEPDEVSTIESVKEKNNSLPGNHKCSEYSESFKTKRNAHLRKSQQETNRRKTVQRDKRNSISSQSRKKNGMTRSDVKDEVTEGDSVAENGKISRDKAEKDAKEEHQEKSSKSTHKNSIMNNIEEKAPSSGNLLTSQKSVSGNQFDDPSKVKLKLYQCEICEEIFSVQCFYKAHMASHKRNGEIPA